jgi:hypothetical protein
VSLIERLARSLPLTGLRALAPKRLSVLLAPQQLACVVLQGRRRLDAGARRAAVVNPHGHWQASVDALRALLRECSAEWAGLPLDISVSGRWSHMVLAPWSDALLSEPGATRFLQTQLIALYGDAARGWHIVGDDAPHGQARAVCGIDATVLQALKELADECGHRSHVIEPLLCTALRALAPDQLRAPSAALALVEPGRITMAALHRGRLAAVQSQPASAAWRLELPQAWQRWTLRAPELADIGQVAVVDLSEKWTTTSTSTSTSIKTGATPAGVVMQLVAETLPPRFHIVEGLFGDGDDGDAGNPPGQPQAGPAPMPVEPVAASSGAAA